MGIMHESPFYQPCMLVESEVILFVKETDFVLSILLSVLICYILQARQDESCVHSRM